jgi:RNA polymerase sigma-70 factor (ECF subfamily)
MNTTSPSLLERLRRPAEEESWSRFVKLYTPLLYSWARRIGLQDPDAADLVQDVLTLLVQKLPEFRYDGSKSFRGWMHTLTLNRWRETRRRAGSALPSASPSDLAELACPTNDEEFWEKEYRQHLVGRALQLMQADFQPTTWKACWEFVVTGRPAADVAAELGITVDVVYSAKSRVLRRLRHELDGLLD